MIELVIVLGVCLLIIIIQSIYLRAKEKKIKELEHKVSMLESVLKFDYPYGGNRGQFYGK